MGTTYVCQRCHNKFTDCKLLDGADYGNYLRDQGMFSRGSWYCKSCYEAAKREFKASKKAEKAAKQATHEEEYESGGGSSSSGELPSGCVKIVGMVLAFLVVCGILGMLFCKNEDANDPAVKMAKWEEHLEKRRAAFAEGLSEEGVEARGLKNFTWEEWQNRSKAKAAENPAEKVEDISEKYRAHMNKRMSFLNAGHTDAEAHALGLDDYTFEAFKQNYKNIKYKTPEEIQQIEAEAKARAEAEAKAKAEAVSELRADSLARKEAEAKARAEASARAKAEAENKRLAEKLARKEAEEKARVREQARVKMAAETKAKAEAESKRLAEKQAREKAKAEAESKRLAEKQAREKAEAKARVEAEAKAKAEADAKSNVSVGSEDSVSGLQDGDKHKPSKDSNGIRIVVQGKGKTKDAAVRWAIRDAVWKTVGTWVDSKARIQENHDKVVAQVKTITEADVAKFEVMDTQMQDGGFVVKVRVSVSKKKIAPKFAEIFPDVFGNE